MRQLSGYRPVRSATRIFVSHVMHEFVDMAQAFSWRELTTDGMVQHWPEVIRELERSQFAVDWSAATAAEQRTLYAIAMNRLENINTGLVTRLIRKGLVSRV